MIDKMEVGKQYKHGADNKIIYTCCFILPDGHAVLYRLYNTQYITYKINPFDFKEYTEVVPKRIFWVGVKNTSYDCIEDVNGFARFSHANTETYKKNHDDYIWHKVEIEC